MVTKVFIATSLDGYIADCNGGVEWLYQIPNPKNDDMGFKAHMKSVDALIMGKNTFNIVKDFNKGWIYKKAGFIVSNSLTYDDIPENFKEYITIVNGAVEDILEHVTKQNYNNIYIDGGNIITQFLQKDLIDELTIATIPVLLGSGIKLFGDLQQQLWFKHINTNVYLNNIVQTTFKRNRT